MMVRMLFAAGAAVALYGQSANQDALLARGRDRILEAIDRMPRYTCTQTVDRSEFEQVAPHLDQGSCDRILANRTNGVSRLDLIRSDRLRLEVQVANGGFEMFSWPGASRVSSERVQDFAGGGLIGTGAFGPFLADIFSNRGVRFWPEGTATINGMMLAAYRYLVPVESSHYRVMAGGSTRVVPFEGRFWLDPDTADLRRLLVRTGELSRSTANCEGSTTVDFTRLPIGAGEHLMATKSVLRVIRRDAAEQENVTTYAACHEFHGEVAIHYDGVEESTPADAATGTLGTATGKPPAAFPAGVRVNIHFDGGIDRAVSAAGDLLSGQVRHTERNPKKRLLPVAGAPVRCRIVRQENDVRESKLNVSLACESVELNGNWVPFAAVPDKGADLSNYIRNTTGTDRVTIQRRGYPARTPSLVFPTGDPQSEKGPLTLDWITIAPSKPAPGA